MATATQRVQNHGSGGELFGIMLVNLLLTVVTLGIYRFWAKTRVRSYLWSQTSIDDERLQYTGTGKELFVAYLKVVCLVFIGVVAVQVGRFLLGLLPASIGNPLSYLAGGAIFGLVIVGLSGIRYQVWRYLLSRTNYRGIRCGLAGSAWYYGLTLAGYILLNVATLGLALP